MHFIDQDDLEVDLPNNWNQTVLAAWAYVERKRQEAEEEVRNQAAEKNWAGDELLQKVNDARVKAQKAAITYKSIWSNLSDFLAAPSKGKCWYCETTETRSDNPIDHFRPKNRVVECQDHPGYWWLAFDWKNYRFSCTYCNSRRVDPETSGGKHDHFPIFTPPDWNRSENDRNIEKPMLLDPIDDRDCGLITFTENGEVTPTSKSIESEDYKKAEKSIELYHLNHKPVVRERRVIFQEIRGLITSVNELLAEGLGENSEAIKRCRKRLIRLTRHECKSTKFNTAARIYIKEHQDNHQWIKELLGRI